MKEMADGCGYSLYHTPCINFLEDILTSYTTFEEDVQSDVNFLSCVVQYNTIHTHSDVITMLIRV